MISFRFHIVSIVAVFLALAIGIVIGSTVIDQTIVDSLEDRVDDVRGNLRDRQAENDALNEQVDELEAFVGDSAATAVDGRLEDVVTVLVTDRGVDGGPVDRTVELLAEAGSAVRGILTLDGSWALDDPEEREALADVVDLEADEPVEVIQERAASLVVADLSSTVEVVGDGTGALDEVAELGLVDFEVMSEEIASRSSDVMFVVVSGPESDLAPSTGHTIPFATSAAEASGGVVLAEVWVEQEDGPDRADSLAGVLGDPELSAQITTVDDLDLSFGPTTVVLALAAVQAGDIGHYGVGDIADLAAPLPPEEQ
ncbi:MAG TPA: copper transporter [Acidimicrobiales bacterium]|nr:copper transporter [Acidimicrobiales bacterium]